MSHPTASTAPPAENTGGTFDVSPHAATFEALAKGTITQEEALAALSGKTPLPTPPAGETSSASDSLLAGKYKTPGDLSNGVMQAVAKLIEKGDTKAVESFYKTLETSLSSGGKTPQVAPTPTAPDVAAAAAAAAVKSPKDILSPVAKDAPAVTPPELPLAVATKEFNETGALTPETMTKLAAVGLTQEYVSTYMAGVKALELQRTSELAASVGGAQVFNAAIEWGQANLPPTEQAAYESGLSNPATAKVYAEALVAKMTAARGYTAPAGAIAGGKVPDAASSGIFKSEAEWQAAMSDPRFETNPAYKEEVMTKTQRSMAAGTIR